MANLNRVLLMGNLTRDPELRYIPSGSAVANLRMAINRTYKSQTGETKEEVTYIGVVVWGKQAENCSEYLAKGSPIFVEGRLQSRQWETEDGQKRSVVEVVADRVQFLARKKDSAAAAPSGPSEEHLTPSTTGGEDDIPF
jgi:single-strand DNA-binding protein